MGDITRRHVLVSIATAAGCPALLSTLAAQGPKADGQTVTYRSGQSDISAYLVKPAGAGPHPAVIVVHDNRGLSEHIRDVARRFAAAGFVALAPDLLSRLGGTGQARQPAPAAGDTTGESNRMGDAQAIARLPATAAVDDLRAGVEYLGKLPDVDAARLATVGFGWGGWRSFTLATTTPAVRKVVVFYSASPDTGFEKMQASVLAHYAEWDNQVTGNALWTKEMMEKAGKTFRYYVYPRTDAAFFNDTGSDYVPDAAKVAWQRTLDFLNS